MPTPERKTFQSQGATLSYFHFENPGKPALVGLHGWQDSGESFRFLYDLLLPNFDCYFLDWRGHGNSEHIKEGLYFHGLYLADLITFTSLIRTPYVLLGHSMGAGLAARFAGLYPEELRALVLFEGFSGLQSMSQERERMRQWGDLLRKQKKIRPTRVFPSIGMAKELLGKSLPELTEDRLAALAEGLVRPVPGGYVWKHDPQLREKMAPIPFPPALSRELWQNITCPTVILYGNRSHLLPKDGFQEIADHFKEIELIALEDVGHNMHQEQPEKVSGYLSTFFTKWKLI